jgi:hypothetical protein
MNPLTKAIDVVTKLCLPVKALQIRRIGLGHNGCGKSFYGKAKGKR